MAYALTGTVDRDLLNEPLGYDADRRPVYLREVWPSQAEIQAAIAQALDPKVFVEQYSDILTGNETWNAIPASESAQLYNWDPESTYIQEPPFWMDLGPEARPAVDIQGARVLAMMGDSVTTDHISPAGSIASRSSATFWAPYAGVAGSSAPTPFSSSQPTTSGNRSRCARIPATRANNRSSCAPPRLHRKTSSENPAPVRSVRARSRSSTHWNSSTEHRPRSGRAFPPPWRFRPTEFNLNTTRLPKADLPRCGILQDFGSVLLTAPACR